jgi:hypothetical protein
MKSNLILHLCLQVLFRELTSSQSPVQLTNLPSVSRSNYVCFFRLRKGMSQGSCVVWRATTLVPMPSNDIIPSGVWNLNLHFPLQVRAGQFGSCSDSLMLHNQPALLILCQGILQPSPPRSPAFPQGSLPLMPKSRLWIEYSAMSADHSLACLPCRICHRQPTL